ncbi:MAG: hypothetical protein AB7G75_21190 [Candidatus Binatia bacterium]
MSRDVVNNGVPERYGVTTHVMKIASLGILFCVSIFLFSFWLAPVPDVYVVFSFATGVLLAVAAFLQAEVRDAAFPSAVKFVLLVPVCSLFLWPSLLPRYFFPEQAEGLYWVHDLSLFGAGLCAGLLLFRHKVERLLETEGHGAGNREALL